MFSVQLFAEGIKVFCVFRDLWTSAFRGRLSLSWLVSTMASAGARKQDLPPEGGYSKIIYERNPGKVFFKGRYLLAAWLGISWVCNYIYFDSYKEIRRDRLERKGGLNAVFPFLLAERDRAFLKRVHYNRETERELMKDVPGWEVGTYHGEPIFKTINPEETWVDPIFEDFYWGVDPKVWSYKCFRNFYC